jgi:ribonuclease-3
MTLVPRSIRELESHLSSTFQDEQLFEQALTHRSFYFENRGRSNGHNERLEFLGDAVLDLAISAELMRLYPEENEGVLSKWRASLVNETVLAEQASRLDLGQFLRVGKGELLSQALQRPRLLASAYEALVGALFLDAGYEATQKFLADHFHEGLRHVSATSEFEADYKTRLQEKVQKETHAPPDYRIVKTEGPDHNKKFFVEVSVQGKILAMGEGASRKQAEQQAAQLALYQDKAEI